MGKPEMAPWAFVLAVPDLDRSAHYFRDVLGFAVSWEDGPDWRLVQRKGVRIMLGHCPNDMRPSDIGSHNWFGYITVVDIDRLLDEFTRQGARCSSPVTQSYGMREIVVTTIDGHRIVFGQELAASTPAPAAGS